MTLKPLARREGEARSFAVLVLLAGLFGLGVQFLPDMDYLAFFVGVGALGGLAAGSQNYDERDSQLLWQSYGTAFQWLLFVVYAAYAAVEILRWLQIGEAVTGFMNAHWPALVASSMCLLLGIAGLRNFHKDL